MKMNGTYQKAINETLQSTTTGDYFSDLTLNNELRFPVTAYLISDSGWWIGGLDHVFTNPPGYPGLVVPAIQTMDVGPTEFDRGWYFLFLNAHSGAFVAVIQVDSAVYSPNNGRYWINLDETYLLDPNGIGSVPEPNESVVIPPDSPRVVVGSGLLPTGNTVVREQYWQRLPDSYSIAAGAKRAISYTTTSGMESTTSEQSKVGASVMGNTSAGWGPVSATLSASLSNNSTTFQQTTTNVEMTAFVSQLYDNTKEGAKTRICFYWQLTNLLTVFDNNGNALSSLIYGSESPAVIDAHNLDDLPPRPLKKELPMSADMQARLSVPSLTPAAGQVQQRSTA
nr:hypothetical protein OG999_10465 [Streptomyces sp. NBC_00886]